jgi:hypothetical protein
VKINSAMALDKYLQAARKATPFCYDVAIRLEPVKPERGTMTQSTSFDFNNLSNKEIAELHRKTADLARQQHQHNLEQARAGAAEDAASQLGIDGEEESYRDSLGYVIDGPRPRSELRYYQDARGNMIELAPGENAPETPSTLKQWALENLDDPDVEEAASSDGLEVSFRVCVENFIANGTVKRGGIWRVVVQDANGQAPNFAFNLKGRLDRDSAISSAAKHIRSYTGLDDAPQPITQEQLNEIAIIASAATDYGCLGDAVIEYLRFLYPNETVTTEFLVREDRRAAILEAMLFVLQNASTEMVNPSYPSDDAELDYMEKNIRNRHFVNIKILIDLHEEYAKQRSWGLGSHRLKPRAPKPVTEADLEVLSDDEVARLLNETLVERARARY